MQERGLAPKTMANALTVARMVLSDAGFPAAAAGIRLPHGRRVAQSLTEQDAQALREVLDRHATDPDVALGLLLETGLRVGELRALLPGDVRGLSLRVKGTKSASSDREVDLSDRAAHLVQRLAAATQVGERRLRRVLARRCAEAGVPRIRVHDLRHTRITLLLLAEVPVLYVSKQAGHSSPAMTLALYGHAIAASARDRARWRNAA